MTDIVERLAGPFMAEPAALRAMDEAADEIARLRAGGCARDQGTTQYCAEAAKLAAENERLRAWNAEIALNAREFAEALREIINFDTDEDISNEECMRDIARAALEGRDD